MTRLHFYIVASAVVLAGVLATSGNAAPIDAFESSPFFGEQTRTLAPDEGVRVLVNAAGDFDPAKPTQLIFFALPNGNTIEQTMGCSTTPGMDWHFDIQHVAAQIRFIRSLSPEENIVVAACEANTKSWPAWRQARSDSPARIRKIIDAVARTIPGETKHITLSCHSGGGAFLFSFIDGGDAIPAAVSRMVWLDANYSYDDPEKHHGEKLLAWLNADATRQLVVIAYDDRNITLNGKKVVSETGGTFRASHRMIDRFKSEMPLSESTAGDFQRFVGLDGRAVFQIHSNPEVKILHTVLVERNGLIEALTLGTPRHEAVANLFWGERAYKQFIQPGPTTRPATTQMSTTRPTTLGSGIPPRAAGAVGGKAFAQSIKDLPREAREAAVVSEILQGNVPNFLRALHPVTLQADGHFCVVRVTPDYLAVGSDEDFLRIPMTPASATKIADAFGFSLPTVKIVDAIYSQAEVKLEPRPLTEQREAAATFAQHNAIIEQQRAGQPIGRLVAGIKKDVVLTNALVSKPGKVAIYGWHKLDGRPIQPLYVGHADWYVDYSHGIRLVSRMVEFDGVKRDLLDVLSDPAVCGVIGEAQPIAVAHPQTNSK